MNKSSSNEINEFLDLFSEKTSYPDPNFKYKLKKRFINEYNSTSRFLDIVNINGWRFIIASLLVIFGFVVLGSIEVVNLNKADNNNSIFSDKQKNELVENIIKNNNLTLLNKATSSKPLNINNPQSQGIIQPNLNDYNYRESKISFKPGIITSICGNNTAFPTIDLNTQSYEYFSNDLNYYKYVSTNKDGRLINYTLGKIDKNISEVIEYDGAKSATRLIKGNKDANSDGNLSEKLLSYPLSFPVSYTSKMEVKIDLFKEYLKQYSGSDTKITKLFKENNNEYYILQRRLQLPCTVQNTQSYLSYPLSFAGSNDIDTIYYQDFVDSKNYTISKSEIYLNEIKAENLIGTIRASSTKKLISLSEIQGLFKFEYNVEINNIK